MKRMFKLVKDLIIMFGGYVLFALGSIVNPVFIIPSLAAIIYSACDGTRAINNDFIKNSCFHLSNRLHKVDGKTTNVRYIVQDIFSLKESLNGRKQNDKKAYFALQGLNTLQQLPVYNKRKELIKYGTTSQSFTLLYLKQLEKLGYINNLKYTKAKSSRLSLERFLLGVENKNRKYNMYKIFFNLNSDKRLTKDNVIDLLGELKFDYEKYESREIDNMLIFGGLKEEYKDMVNVSTQEKKEFVEKEETVEETKVEQNKQVVSEVVIEKKDNHEPDDLTDYQAYQEYINLVNSMGEDDSLNNNPIIDDTLDEDQKVR